MPCWRFWMLLMANKMRSPSFYKKTAVAFCHILLRTCAFGRIVTANTEKMPALQRVSAVTLLYI